MKTSLILILLSLSAAAATINATSCSNSDVQTAINSASNGDTVVVPSGSCSWSSVATSNSVGITLQGGSGGTTTISGAITVNQTSSTLTRVTGFTFTTGGSNGACGAMTINGTYTSALAEIDHNVFANNTQSTFICLYGNAPVLITTNQFTDGGASEMIHNLAMGPSDASGWTNGFTPASPNQVYIENNTFTNTDSTYICSAVESYYGARTVMRYNTLNFCQLDQHGTAGMIGVRWWEVYNNTFNNLGLNQCCYITMRAGSGVIFNNTAVGNNQGAGSIDLYEEDSGYPAVYQIGRGINQEYSPAYVWGNSSNMPAGSGSSNVVEGQDFFVSSTQPSSMVRCELAADGGTAAGLQGSCPTTYNYVPYTYPYPVQSGASVPAPPSGLSASVK